MQLSLPVAGWLESVPLLGAVPLSDVLVPASACLDVPELLDELVVPAAPEEVEPESLSLPPMEEHPVRATARRPASTGVKSCLRMLVTSDGLVSDSPQCAR